jgi:hypothetical protein
MISAQDKNYAKVVINNVKSVICELFNIEPNIELSFLEVGSFSFMWQHKEEKLRISCVREYELMKQHINPWCLTLYVQNPQYDSTIPEKRYSGQTIKDIRTEPFIDFNQVKSLSYPIRGESLADIKVGLISLKQYIDDQSLKN